MNSNSYNELKYDIKELRELNREATSECIKHAYSTYIKALIIFGSKSTATIDCLNVIHEIKAIIKEENIIFEELLKSNADMSKINIILDDLDELSEQTINYYNQVIDNISLAIDMRDVSCATRPPKTFSTLIETDEYKNRIISLSISLDDVEEFLNFEDEFWIFIDPRTSWLNSYDENSKYFYGVSVKEDKLSGIITNFHITVPKIVDLKTAKICVHEFKYAYEIYKSMNMIISPSKNQKIEEAAGAYEAEFQKQYIMSNSHNL